MTSTRHRSLIVRVAGLAIPVLSAAALTVAALASVPLMIMALVFVACVGCSMFAAVELSEPRTSKQVPPLDPRILAQWRAMTEFRDELDRLPETKHPFGF